MRRYHSQDIKAYVIYLRYASLTKPGPKWHTFREISQIAGVKLTSAYSIVDYWEKNGYRFINRRLG